MIRFVIYVYIDPWLYTYILWPTTALTDAQQGGKSQPELLFNPAEALRRKEYRSRELDALRRPQRGGPLLVYILFSLAGLTRWVVPGW